MFLTVELVRKHAEHHDMQLAPLQEIALHQESIEKIEFIQDWCPKLQILLMQSNLISKIENLHKLKNLEYLNLAINNIEKIENLERCESLQKLDLTLNFIGELTSISSLKDNYNLRLLYLNGNPCTDYDGYRDYVIAILPQLNVLDSFDITRSERIEALQNLPLIENKIIKQQKEYSLKREDQKNRLEKEIEEKWKSNDPDIDDEEKCKRFWNEKSEHAPEVRVEMDRQTRLQRNKDKKDEVVEKKSTRPLFAPDGRPFNVNQAKIPFKFSDENPDEYKLELQIYKYLDTSLIDIDIQPLFVRINVKNKIFQLCLPEEINTTESVGQRSQTTGFLSIIMPKHNKIIRKNEILQLKNETKKENKFHDAALEPNNNQRKREFLEIGPAKKNLFDFNIDTSRNINKARKFEKGIILIPEKQPSDNFEDNPEVPPLI